MATEQPNSLNKNEDFIAKAQRFYKLQISTSASERVKGREMWELQRRRSCAHLAHFFSGIFLCCERLCYTGSVQVEALDYIKGILLLQMDFNARIQFFACISLIIGRAWRWKRFAQNGKLCKRVFYNCTNAKVKSNRKVAWGKKCCDKNMNMEQWHVFLRFDCS